MKVHIIFFILFTVFCQILGQPYRLDSALYDKRYNEITYVRTHNAQSHKESILFKVLNIDINKSLLKFLGLKASFFNISNQDHTIIQQLNDGVRNLHLPLHPCGSSNNFVTYVCHGFYPNDIINVLNDTVLPKFIVDYVDMILKKGIISPCIFDCAARPLDEVLQDIKEFLRANPREVVTLSFGGTMQNNDVIAASIEKAGLQNYAHSQSLLDPWPMLQTMIDTNKRLVLFVRSSSPYPWLHYERLFQFSSNYGQKDSIALQADITIPDSQKRKGSYLNRHREPKNKLFLINHQLTPLLGGTKKGAQVVNEYNVLKNRIKALIEDTGVKPTFIGVDFYEYGDVFKIVDELNRSI